MAFVVSALAVAGPHANAVGALRLRCDADALAIELTHVARYSAGFIPGAVVRDQSLLVPYTAVRAFVRRGPLLYLTLDATSGSPHRRFALTRFTDAPPETLLGAHRASVALRALTWALPIPIGALAALLVSGDLLGGPVGLASFGALVALGVLATLRAARAIITRGGPLSELRRDAFEDAMSRRLGLAPDAFEGHTHAHTERARAARERILQAVAASRRPPPPPPPHPPAGQAPRASAARRPASARSRGLAPLAIGVAAASAMLSLGIIAAKRYAVKVTPPPAAPLLLAGLRDVTRDIAATPIAGDALPSCSCVRADSPLWAEPLPSLTVILIPRGDAERVEPRIDEHGLGKYRFEIAAINNTREPLEDVRIVVTFARRRPSGERVGANDRGFYVRRLGPARAVKWQVEGSGTELRVDVPTLPPLTRGDGSDEAGATALPALAEGFIRLGEAGEPSVRAHAAMMLAYLRHPGAEAAAAALEASSQAAERQRQRVLRAAAPAFTCAARSLPGGYDVCVHNGSSSPLRGAMIQELRDGNTLGVGSPIGAEIPAGQGLRVTVRHALPEDVHEVVVR